MSGRVFVLAAAFGVLLAAAAVSSRPVLTPLGTSRPAAGDLSVYFHADSCPQLETIVRSSVDAALQQNVRLTAGLLRLLFHDCFPQGCDASILLDNGERGLPPNVGLQQEAVQLVEDIRGKVHAACGPTVSCADITVLATRDAVSLSGGPSFTVPLGRLDSAAPASSNDVFTLPPPTATVDELLTAFGSKNLSDPADLVALSGAHTIGAARCATFRARVYNDTNISAGFAAKRRQICQAQAGASDGNLAPLDAMSSVRFDNGYFRNLVAQFGLLHSDQELFGGGAVDSITAQYARNGAAFSRDFVTAVLKMGSIGPLTGSSGEIRANCRKPN